MKIRFLIVLVLVGHQMAAQTYSSQLLDTKTKRGIPYATIQYGKNKGVVTNEEGRFSFTVQEQTQLLDSIYISSMGYKKLGFTLEQLQDSVITMKPKAIELSEVYVFDQELDVNDIIEKVKKNLEKNHRGKNLKKRFFLRESEYGNLQKVKVDLEKSTIKELNKSFIDSVTNVLPRKYEYFSETLGDFYLGNGQESNKKLNIIKAAELYDKNQEISMEAFGKRLENILEKRVKKDSYLKIKSGWFGTKVQFDSIMEMSKDSMSAENKRKESVHMLSNRKNTLKDLHQRLLSKEFALDVITKTHRYDFSLNGYTEIEGEGTYVISFKTKGKSDFTGQLFINVDDFAIMRVDYKNIKSIKKFKLLGFMFNQHTYNGCIVFTKTPFNNYSLRFAKHNSSSIYGIDRPLKLVEKNKNVKGRRKQNELKLNIDIVQTELTTQELVIFNIEENSDHAFNTLKEDKSIEATYMPTYNPEFWKGYTIMEPNQAIREFTVNQE